MFMPTQSSYTRVCLSRQSDKQNISILGIGWLKRTLHVILLCTSVSQLLKRLSELKLGRHFLLTLHVVLTHISCSEWFFLVSGM